MNHIRTAAWTIVAAVAMLPTGAAAQTVRGDFNMDGRVNISDVTAMANYLSTGMLGEVSPADRDTLTVNGVPFVMVRVKGGTYTLKYGRVYTVPDFWIGQTEVTFGLWWAVMGSDSHYYADMSGDRALRNTSWEECQTFLEEHNALTGRNFRLPYSDEWTFAASGGTLTNSYTYCGSNDIDEVAWYAGNCPGGHGDFPVAARKPNELGLYDMSGNMAEWVQEIRESVSYPSGYLVRTAWLFGGSYTSGANECRPTSFTYHDPSTSIGLAGFRLVIPTDEAWQPSDWPVVF